MLCPVEYVKHAITITQPVGQLHTHMYRMEAKFGGGKVWRIDSFRAFGERKFGELIDQPID